MYELNETYMCQCCDLQEVKLTYQIALNNK